MSRLTFTIASLTVREASRRRLLLALAGISIVMIGLSAWGFDRLSSSPSFTLGESVVALSQSLILFMFMFSFVVALTASAIASPSVASEIESGVIMTVVTRPINRREVIVGKWLGLAGLLLTYTAAVSLVDMAVVDWVSGYLPPSPVLVTVYLFAEGLLLLTFALFLSTRLSTLAAGVVGIALFGAAWLAGVVGSLGVAFNVSGLRTIGAIGRYVIPTDGLWRGAIYYLEPSAALPQHLLDNRSDPFTAHSGPAWTYLLWVVAWFAVVMAAGVISFERRDL
ncbi:MAG TPA: ABC transporter permease [Acidimicrobiales bacterium]|jgi:ABC-type transport system involved in multi-copper enzyme maturation permease subunit|nr:ABC transporter permease [Acidimicrobiales bacterium]